MDSLSHCSAAAPAERVGGHIAGAPCRDSDEEDRIEGPGAGLSAQEIRRSTALARNDYDFGATADPPYPASGVADMGAKVNKVSSELVLTRARWTRSRTS